MKRCYYETLECQKGATADVLKSAYRKLAMRFHPDKNHGDHTAEIKVPTQVACETCSGAGAEPGHSPETCPTCAGYGKVRATQGFFTIERTCSSCRGTGKIIRNPCKTCRGSGLVQKDRMLNVD